VGVQVPPLAPDILLTLFSSSLLHHHFQIQQHQNDSAAQSNA